MISDRTVIDLLNGNNTLLDSRLIGISVTQGESANPNVNLRFRARPGSDFFEIEIGFIDVIAYELTFEEGDRLLDIWELKFLQLDDGSFYITLDPDPSTLPAAGVTNVQANDTDHLFVRARHIQALVTKVGVRNGG